MAVRGCVMRNKIFWIVYFALVVLGLVLLGYLRFIKGWQLSFNTYWN